MKTPDPYQTAQLKIKRADRHIQELESALTAFLDTNPYTLRIKENPKTGHIFVNLQAHSLPETVPLILGDAIHNLRVAIELLINQIITNAGGSKGAKITFRETREEFSTLRSQGEIHRTNPDLWHFIIDTIEPHKGGKFAAWELNKLDVGDKHHLIIPVLLVTSIQDVVVEDSNKNFVHFANVVVCDDQITGLVRTAAEKVEIKQHGNPTIAVVFADGEIFEGQPIIPTLLQLSQLTSEAVETIRSFMTAK